MTERTSATMNSSINPGDAGPSNQPQASTSSSYNVPGQQTYANYGNWGHISPPVYTGYPTAPINKPSTLSSNPYAAHVYLPTGYKGLPNIQSTMKPPGFEMGSNKPIISSELPFNQENFKHWDEVMKTFLVKTKMTQTLKGFENDILALNPDWELQEFPRALSELISGLQAVLGRLSRKQKADEDDLEVDITSRENHVLDERKLSYVHFSNGLQPKTQSSINRSISQFLSRTRARNDASNRAEFLRTLAEKKSQLSSSPEEGSEHKIITSCARVDAKPIDRDKQMKYDIAKNGEGPLTKTVKHDSPSYAVKSPALLESLGLTSSTSADDQIVEEQEVSRKRKIPAEEEETRKRVKRKGKEKAKDTQHAEHIKDAEEISLETATAEKHPGLDMRLKNIEAHFALRYVPSPPRTLIARLKYLEDHLIKLEKEYPPWAALHFNQPNRGWPPPLRTTPVIVPPQLRSSANSTVPSGFTQSHLKYDNTNTVSPTSNHTPSPSTQTSTTSVVKSKRATSSLHKAVLERLEVQRAMSEMGTSSKNNCD